MYFANCCLRNVEEKKDYRAYRPTIRYQDHMDNDLTDNYFFNNYFFTNYLVDNYLINNSA